MKIKFFSILAIALSSAVAGWHSTPALSVPKTFELPVEQYIAHYDIDELEAVEKRIRANPNDAGAYLHRAMIRSHSQEDFTGALADFSRSLELNPNQPEAYNYRGTSYFWLKKYQQALNDYNQALRLDPKLTIAYYNRGYVRIELGDRAGAIEDFRQGAALSKKEGDTLSHDQALEIIRDLEGSQPK
jgi:tetratricopeptide (TPR) repeat protein